MRTPPPSLRRLSCVTLLFLFFLFSELIGAACFTEPGKAPGTKNESVPTLQLTQQDPHSESHRADTTTFPSPVAALIVFLPTRTHSAGTHAIAQAPALKEMMSGAGTWQVTESLRNCRQKQETEGERGGSDFLCLDFSPDSVFILSSPPLNNMETQRCTMFR